jgi:hypothetical protein
MPLKPTGFWSYTSRDDSASGGRLSQLRQLLADQLQQHVGRTQVHVFQDVASIAPGADWERQIREALAESSFFIPIVTPAFLQSEWCCREVTLFRAIMEQRGRDDLIVPIHYLDVDRFADARRGECYDPAVFDFLRTKQWVDFRPLRLRNPGAEEVLQRLDTVAGWVQGALFKVVAEPEVVVLEPIRPEPFTISPSLRAAIAPLLKDIAPSAPEPEACQQVETSDNIPQNSDARIETPDRQINTILSAAKPTMAHSRFDRSITLALIFIFLIVVLPFVFTWAFFTIRLRGASFAAFFLGAPSRIIRNSGFSCLKGRREITHRLDAPFGPVVCDQTLALPRHLGAVIHRDATVSDVSAAISRIACCSLAMMRPLSTTRPARISASARSSASRQPRGRDNSTSGGMSFIR